MKWIKITAVLAVLLIVVNIFLIYNLLRQYSNTSLIDPGSITQTVRLLRNADIYISESIIPRIKPDYTIFEGPFFTDLEEYYINTALLLSGNKNPDDFTLYMINNGIKIIEKDESEVFEFYNDDIFSFLYMSKNRVSSDLFEYIKDENDIIYDSGTDPKKSNEVKEIEKSVNIKFFGEYILKNRKSPNENHMQAEITKLYYNPDKNFHLAECIETLNGLPIYKSTADCIIYEDTVVYARGNIIFTNAGNSYNTELYDPLSALFDEKAYIEKQRSEPISDEIKSTVEIMTITELRCIYCISWNADRSKYYLIPSWYIEYNGNLVRIRNAVNGNIYTI